MDRSDLVKYKLDASLLDLINTASIKGYNKNINFFTTIVGAADDPMKEDESSAVPSAENDGVAIVAVDSMGTVQGPTVSRAAAMGAADIGLWW